MRSIPGAYVQLFKSANSTLKEYYFNYNTNIAYHKRNARCPTEMRSDGQPKRRSRVSLQMEGEMGGWCLCVCACVRVCRKRRETNVVVTTGSSLTSCLPPLVCRWGLLPCVLPWQPAGQAPGGQDPPAPGAPGRGRPRRRRRQLGEHGRGTHKPQLGGETLTPFSGMATAGKKN